MSKGSKRPGWRAMERRYNFLTRQLRREADAERARNTAAACAECGSTKQTVTRDAELMEEAQGFPLPDKPFCCETIIPKAPPQMLCVRCKTRKATFFTPASADGGWGPICRQCTTLDDRWFAGNYPCGVVYADRGIEEHGDYKRVAFLSYSKLELEIDDPRSPLLERVKADAAAMQARRGQPYQIAGNMTITLGER